MRWEIKKIGKTPRLNHPVFIEGLPGIGNVGKIAVDFIVNELKAKKLYSFYSTKFPHSVFVNENNLVEMPKLDVYYKKFRNGNQDFLFLVGDIQPIDEESCHIFCRAIVEILKRYKCAEVVTTGGIGLQHIPEKPKMYCTGNSKQLMDDYIADHNIESSIYGVVGPIMGVSGLLIGLAGKEKIPGVTLLAETFAHPLYVGVKGAERLLKVLDKRFSLGVNIQRLMDEISKLEEELRKRANFAKMDTTGKDEATYIG